jgi:DNA polymerase
VQSAPSRPWPRSTVLKVVKAWRAAHPATVAFWYGMEDAARLALASQGTVHRVGRVAWRRDGAWLKLKLPSDRVLCYPAPKTEWISSPCPMCSGDKVVPVRNTLQVSDSFEACLRCNGKGTVAKNQLTYAGIDQFTRSWGRIKTYGGKLVENAVQATARDVIASGAIAAERAGFDVLLSVHDELITEVDDESPLTDESLCGVMTQQLGWTAGLPLAAEGFTAGRYRK